MYIDIFAENFYDSVNVDEQENIQFKNLLKCLGKSSYDIEALTISDVLVLRQIYNFIFALI